jgi:hypothetical protein
MISLTKVLCTNYPKSYLKEYNEQKLFNTYYRKTKRKKVLFTPIGTDGKSIVAQDKVLLIEQFFSTCSKKKNYLVGTLREYEAMLPYICRTSIHISVMEREFPIFDDIKYFTNPAQNKRQVVAKYDLLKKYGIFDKSLASALLPKHKKKFFRSISSRNHIDSYFGLADNTPYREVFAMSEERSERSVIALDVNSMFLHCMKKPFGKPSSLRRVKNVEEINFSNPPSGLYRTFLSKPKTNFIKKYHPFKMKQDMDDYNFEFTDDEEVEAYISSEEYIFYKRHFHNVNVVECFIFDKLIEHPLLKSGLKTFHKKQKAPKGPRKSLLKQELVYLHSVSNSKQFKYKNFNKIDDLVNALTRLFSIKNKPKNNSDLNRLISKGQTKFRIQQNAGGFQLIYRDIYSPKIVSSFGYEIVSRSRLFMMNTLEQLSAFRDIDICYVNVDSVHVSIQETDKANFFDTFADSISDKELGKLKIEGIAENACWLGLGHYYLFSDNTLVKFKSGMTKSPGCNSPVQNKRVVKSIVKERQINFVSSRTIHVENTFSYKKNTVIDSKFIKHERMNLDLLLDDVERTSFICTEIAKSKPIKLKLLAEITDRQA